MNSRKRETMMELLSDCIMRDNPKVRDDFYHFAKEGGISFAEAMLIWNGKPLKKVDDAELEVLFDFFKKWCDLDGKEACLLEEANDEDRKKEFLKSKEAQVYLNYRSMFHRMNLKIERVFNKDLCELSFEELIAGLSNMEFTSYKRLDVCILYFREYVEWCDARGYFCPAFDYLSKMRNKDIAHQVQLEKSAKKIFVSGPEELEHIVQTTCDNFTNKNCTGAVLAILLWLGISLERALTLKTEEVSVCEDVVSVDGVTVRLPQGLRGVLQEYKQIDRIYSEQTGKAFAAAPSIYYIKRFFGVKRNSDSKILLKEADRTMDIRTARNILRKFVLQYNELSGEERKLTELSLRSSGIMWRIKKLEDGGTRVTRDLIASMYGVESAVSASSYLKTYQTFINVFY